MHLSKQIESMYDDAVRIRQDLHRIPEIGFQLRDTQAYVLRELKHCGPDRIETPAVCGVKAVFFAKDAETTIAFRADMDGIHNDEANDVPYCSQHPGNMHGCGHDGHMTILLLFARWIAKNRAHIHCNIVLLFQPGEEGWAGARRMIDDGALENPKVDHIYGLHLWPTVPKGKIGVRWDYLMAQTSDFEITVHGKAAHGSRPELGINPVYRQQAVVARIEALAAKLSATPGEHGTLSLTNVNCVTASNNSVPESSSIVLDRRLCITENRQTIEQEMAFLLDGVDAEWKICDIPGVSWTGQPVLLRSYLPAWEIPEDSRLVQKAKEACRSVFDKPYDAVKLVYTTDAVATAGELGIPTIVLGPGDSNCHAHGTDEYCPVEELIRACEVYVQLCASL